VSEEATLQRTAERSPQGQSFVEAASAEALSDAGTTERLAEEARDERE
jgi:hypothetical protein